MKSTFLGEIIQAEQLMSAFVRQGCQEASQQLAQPPLVLFMASSDSALMSDGVHSIEAKVLDGNKPPRAHATHLAKQINGNGSRSSLLGTFFWLESYVFETSLVPEALRVQLSLRVFSLKYLGNHGVGSMPLLKTSNKSFVAGSKPPALETDDRLKKTLENVRRHHFASATCFQKPLSLNEMTACSSPNKGILVNSSGCMLTPGTSGGSFSGGLRLENFKMKPRIKRNAEEKEKASAFDTMITLVSADGPGEESLVFTSLNRLPAIVLRKSKRPKTWISASPKE